MGCSNSNPNVKQVVVKMPQQQEQIQECQSNFAPKENSDVKPRQKVGADQHMSEAAMNSLISKQAWFEDESVTQKYQQTLNTLQEGSKFVDIEFPANESSLSKNISSFKDGQNLTWKRFSEIVGSDQKIFEGKIEPNDINQGSLGDCYFLSALACLAERDCLISRLFESKNPSNQGCYCVWLCHDGEWKQVVLDDFLPCKNDKPVFSRCKGIEAWVLLLEKAYAKIYGTYQRIEAGNTYRAIRDLTGAPGQLKIIDKNDPDSLWKQLVKYNSKNFLMAAGTNQSNNEGREQNMGKGLYSGHAYAILDIREVTTSAGKEKIMQLRNPWGNSEWQGTWGDKSDKWTDDLKKELNWTDEDDGIFWMPFEDFIKEFQLYDYNKINDNYFYSSSKFNLGGEQKGFGAIQKFTLDKNTNCVISMIQADKRNFKYDESKLYEYSEIKQYICKGTPQNIECVIDYQIGSYKEIYFEQDFEQGNYFIYGEANWNQDYANNIVFSYYGENQIKFLKSDSSYAQDKTLFENIQKKVEKK